MHDCSVPGDATRSHDIYTRVSADRVMACECDQ